MPSCLAGCSAGFGVGVSVGASRTPRLSSDLEHPTPWVTQTTTCRIASPHANHGGVFFGVRDFKIELGWSGPVGRSFLVLISEAEFKRDCWTVGPGRAAIF